MLAGPALRRSAHVGSRGRHSGQQAGAAHPGTADHAEAPRRGHDRVDERGYHGTRVKDVVNLSNTSHGTFYLYFSNKEDLVRALTIEAASEASSLSHDAMVEAGSALDDTSWDHLRVGSVTIRHCGCATRRCSGPGPTWLTSTRASVIRSGGWSPRLTEAMASQLAAAHPATDLDPEVTSMAVLAMLDRFHFMRELVDRPVDEAALDTLTTFVHRALFGPETGRTAKTG